jgi:ankyrin repeat protein
MVKRLIDTGADVSATTRTSQTILRAATRHETVHIDEYLMERGTDTIATGWGNQTPLHDAASQGTAPTLRLLLEAVLDIDARDI